MNKELQTGTDKPKSSCWNAKQPTLACTQVWSRTASRKSSTSLPAGSSWQTENSRPELASKSSRVNATECHTHPDGSCGSSRNGSVPDSRRKAFSSCSESSACSTAKERCPHPWDPAMQCRVDLEPSITLHGPAQGLSSTESTDNVGATDMWVRSLGGEEPLKEGMTAHSSILAWRISRPGETCGLQPTGSHRVRHDLARTHHTV